MTDTVAGYKLISTNIGRSLSQVARRPDIKRESDYYLSHIRSARSADEFLKDSRLYAYAMTAYGLKDMIYAKAFMRKVLTEGIDGEKSFALQLADSRFKEFAEAFNFARYGATATVFDRAQQGTVDRYVRMQLEADAGQGDEGVRLALYFQRKAASVTSVYGLMADAALYKVAQTALGLPAALSAVDIDRQAAILAARMDLDDLRDPEKLEKFITSFTAKWQMGNNSASATPPRIGLVQSSLTGFDNALLLGMQSYKASR